MVVVLFIVGCSGGRGKEDPITSINIYTGVDGITMEFLDNMPPDKLLENEPFSIGLMVKNQGAFDINIPKEGETVANKEANGIIAVTIEEDYMTKINYLTDETSSQTIELGGKSRFNIKGEQIVKRFDISTKLIDPRSEIHTSDIFVTACYKYQTKAVADVCIDTDIYNTKPGEKACEMKTESMVSQGAPVAVTKVEAGVITKTIGGRDYIFPQYLIYIKNKGKGQVITSDSVKKACDATGIDKSNYNRLDIEALLNLGEVGNRALRCEKKPLRLINEEDFVRCSSYDNKKSDHDNIVNGFDKSTVNNFLTPLKITLDYGYTFTISKQIKIHKNR